MTLYDDLESVLAAVTADIDRLKAVKAKLWEALDALGGTDDDESPDVNPWHITVQAERGPAPEPVVVARAVEQMVRVGE